MAAILPCFVVYLEVAKALQPRGALRMECTLCMGVAVRCAAHGGTLCTGARCTQSVSVRSHGRAPDW